LAWSRRAALVLLAFAVLDYLVLPQIAGTKKAVHLLGSIRPGWVVLGIVLEALSLVAYSLLTRSVLTEQATSFAWLIRCDVTALGVSHLLPGGAATATSLRYRLFRRGGIPGEDAAVGMAIEAVGSNLVLAALTWLALVVSIPFAAVHLLYLVGAILGAVLVAVTTLVIVLRSRQATPSDGGLLRLVGRLPDRIRPRVQRAVVGASAQIRQLLADRQTLRNSVAWAGGSWLLDAASLTVFLAAYGHWVNPDGLLVAYGTANLVAILPISPGGLGIIEAVIIPSLVGYGTPRATAVLAVVSWRLFNFWAPIPVSGLCYVSLRAQSWEGRR
jgi:uncharacterized protein (TIRG00374 family)